MHRRQLNRRYVLDLGNNGRSEARLPLGIELGLVECVSQLVTHSSWAKKPRVSPPNQTDTHPIAWMTRTAPLLTETSGGTSSTATVPITASMRMLQTSAGGKRTRGRSRLVADPKPRVVESGGCMTGTV